MKEWTRKRKADVCMGILLQIYFFFPWIRIDGGYHTIHVYLIEIFRKESCIKAYNYIFLSGHPILWKYSGFAAVTFTMIIAFMIVMQMIELWQLYRHIIQIQAETVDRCDILQKYTLDGKQQHDLRRWRHLFCPVKQTLFHCFIPHAFFCHLHVPAPCRIRKDSAFIMAISCSNVNRNTRIQCENFNGIFCQYSQKKKGHSPCAREWLKSFRLSSVCLSPTAQVLCFTSFHRQIPTLFRMFRGFSRAVLTQTVFISRFSTLQA